MAVLHHLPIFKVRIDGKYVPDGFMDDIQEITVDSSLHLPEMVTIQLLDPKLEWVNDQALLDLGKKLVVEVIPPGEPKSKIELLTEVEISAIEPTFLGGGASSLIIRGYNRSNRLHLGKHSRTFTNRSDADIVREIASTVGLQADVDPTGVEYEYIFQNNLTNMEFLVNRASRIGYQVYADKEKLYFKKSDSTLAAAIPKLTLGEELSLFRPRVTTSQQASSVRVFGWDAKGKKKVSAEARPNDQLKQGGMQQTGSNITGKQLELDRFSAVIVDAPISSIDEANAIATGLMNDIGYQFQEADGTCTGNPEIRAGRKIELKGLGERFNGNYFVTSAQHIYDSSGYRVEFSISGRQPNTMQHLLRPTNGQALGRGERFYGVTVGLVTNLNDPDQLGRVKVKFPWIFDDDEVEIESTWARVVNPSAGQQEKGFYFLPEIDDEVLIAFEHGDVNRPYLLGALWNSKDKPPKDNSGVIQDGKVIERIIRSRLQHQLIFNDSDDKPSITIETSGGHKIILDDTPGQMSITIVDSTGSNQIKIDSIQNAGTFEVKGPMKITSVGPLEIESKASIKMTAPVININ